MTAESEQLTNTPADRPLTLSPWLVLLAALALYALTLNHWVTFRSLSHVAQITGWDWHPAPLSWRPAPEYRPLFLILTSPLRLIPVGLRPLGLNLLNAVFAALTLAILARSVRLLPHGRTKAQIAAQDRSTMSMGEAANSRSEVANEQRLREGAEFGLLTMRTAFLPAMFAVLLLGTQLTFWENAVSATGEMLDLLVFAFLILCLLEFRVCQNDKWLTVFAFVYGLGVANDWGLIGFFPCFLVALLWIKRLSFFNLKFLARTTCFGLLGLLLYALIPILGVINNDGTFWDILRQILADQHLGLIRLPRYFLLIAGLPTLLPILFAAINWPFPEGEFSVSHSIARQLFRLLHVTCLAVGVLMFFDANFSPSPRARFGLGVTDWPGFLTFYYLSALSVGYFSGYVLLVFSRVVLPRWGEPTALINGFNKTMLALLWGSAIALPGFLLCVNFLHVRDLNRSAVSDFGNEMAKSLPANSAIVLADDPARLYLAMGASQRLGLAGHYIFVEGRDLPHREYLKHLVERYPEFRKELINPDKFPRETTGQQAGMLLALLSLKQPVYYLHPSFGNYFERACLTPNRLGQDVHPYPTNALSTLVLAPPQIATNRVFWHALEQQSLAALPQLAERSAEARRVANYYSVLVDCWGVELQEAATGLKIPGPLKTELLNDANDQFAEAFRLNTNNIVARANQQFNARLRDVQPGGAPMDLHELVSRLYFHWDSVLDAFGPVDVPELDIEFGRHFAQLGAYLQAAHLFERSLELAPNNPAGELDLAKIYIELGLSDAALGLIKDMHQQLAADPLELARAETLANVTKADFEQADRVLIAQQNKDPENEKLSRMAAEFYRLIGYTVLRQSNRDPARQKIFTDNAAIWFKKALTAYDQQLARLGSAAANMQEIYENKLRKAEIMMAMRDFDAAIVILNALVTQDPQKPIPLLNRANSELELNQLEAAKTDYLAVEKMAAAPLPLIYYGLARVAQKQNDVAAEIESDKAFLKCASHYSPEFTNVTQRLQKLEGH